MLHTLYQQSLRHQSQFFVEYFALDLIMEKDKVCSGGPKRRKQRESVNVDASAPSEITSTG